VRVLPDASALTVLRRHTVGLPVPAHAVIDCHRPDDFTGAQDELSHICVGIAGAGARWIPRSRPQVVRRSRRILHCPAHPPAYRSANDDEAHLRYGRNLLNAYADSVHSSFFFSRA
jgi:hypothetical protein